MESANTILPYSGFIRADSKNMWRMQRRIAVQLIAFITHGNHDICLEHKQCFC